MNEGGVVHVYLKVKAEVDNSKTFACWVDTISNYVNRCSSFLVWFYQKQTAYWSKIVFD